MRKAYAGDVKSTLQMNHTNKHDILQQTNMKKLAYIMFIALVAVFVSSCKEKTRMQQVQEFRNSLSSTDTTQMLKLCNDCMDLLKAQKVENALSMLYEYNDSTKEIQPLTDKTRKQYERRFKVFPVLDYTMDYYSFQLEGVNDVKYRITFALEENPEQNGNAVTAMMFNPVKVDGVWYLTIKNGTEFDRMRN